MRRRRHHERRRLPLRRLAVLVAVQLAVVGPASAGVAHASRPAAAVTAEGSVERPGRSGDLLTCLRAHRARQVERQAAVQPGEGVVSYVPPVDAPVVDPFRPPLVPWGPGNRGLEYDTSPGDPVRASADGVVTFAGRVGGMSHVTIQHADGLRTGYSFLAGVAVARGQVVRQGAPVGWAGEAFHFGARVGDAYVDPAALFDTGATVVELLPYEVPPGSRPEREAALIDEAFTGGGGGGGGSGGGGGRRRLAAAYDWLRDRAGATASSLGDHSAPGRAVRMAFDLGERLFFPGPCSSGPAPVAPVAGERRLAVTVAGLGSSSDGAAIGDLRAGELGYGPGSVLRFSYAGGAVPASAGAAGRFGIDTRPYGSADTQGDLRVAADRLAGLVAQVLAADPAVTVDLYAHSQGGVVTRLALARLADRGADLGRLGLVATLGTPHAGADLASAVRLLGGRPSGGLALDAGRAAAGVSIDPDAVSVAQLAEGSDVVAELAAGVPEGVHLVSIAARDDLVVASPNTAVAGATNVTVPVGGVHAHSDLVGSDAATAELARALAREPPACERVGDAVRDVVTGHAISATEDTLGALAFALAP